MDVKKRKLFLFVMHLSPLCLLLLWLAPMLADGQSILATLKNSKFDSEDSLRSILTRLPRMRNDSSKVRLLNALGNYFATYSRSDGFEKATGFLQEGIHLSESAYPPDSPDRFMSQMLLARTYLMYKKIPTGEELFRKVIDSYRAFGNKRGEADALFLLASSLAETDHHEIESKYLAASTRAIQLYQELGDVFMEIEAKGDKAYFLHRWGYYQKADQELKALADLSIAHGCFQLVLIYNRLGVVNRYQGEFNAALEYSLAALRTAEELGDIASRHGLVGELALEYGELGKSKEAIDYYKECIALREKQHIQQYGIYRTATLMTSEMIKIGRGQEGYEFLRALMLRNTPRGNIEKAIIEHGLANCLAAIGKNDLAGQYYLSMLGSYERLESTEVKFLAQLDAFNFFVRAHQWEKAKLYYDTLSEALPGSVMLHRDVELSLFRLDSALHRYSRAIGHLQLYKRYNDSVFTREKSQQIEALRIRYHSEQKDQNIALLRNQTELQQATLQQSEILRKSLLAGTIMLILLLALLYSRYRLKTKNNLLLEKQRAEISRKNFAQQLLLNEKDWLVREIHHRVKNNFHMVVGLMGTQSAYIKSTEALQALEDSKHRIQTMSLIHQKLYQSENLSATMMSDYVHELVSYLKDSFQASHIIFTIDCEPIELGLSYSLPLGLILNEAITNSIKYAFPGGRQGTIQIELTHTSADRVQLIICDNGIGMSAKKDGVKPSMGMNLMAGLTEDIGGVFNIKSENGTIIEIDFCYEEAKHMGS